MAKLVLVGALMVGMSSTTLIANELKVKDLAETKSGSITFFGCPNCKTEDEVEEVKLDPGTQVFEVRKLGEEMRVFRTENWLGGSPVTFVHPSVDRAATAMLAEANDPQSDMPAELIDQNAVSSIGEDTQIDLAISAPEMLIIELEPSGEATRAAVKMDRPGTDVHPASMAPVLEEKPEAIVIDSALNDDALALAIGDVVEVETAASETDISDATKSVDADSFSLRLN